MLGDDSPAAVHEKERRYSQFRELHADFRRLRQACDLWTAAFFAKLEKPEPAAPERIPTTDHVLRALRNQPGIQGVMKTALDLAQEHRFFHWPLEFPEVFSGGGFDVALGNPPWEIQQFSESEFFTSKRPDISQLPGHRRKEAIKKIETEDRQLFARYQAASMALARIRAFISGSGRYVRSGRGRANMYAQFTELGIMAIDRCRGVCGFLVPTALATSETTSSLFSHIIESHLAVSVYDFENSRPMFERLHRSYKFCLLTLRPQQENFESSAYLHDIPDLTDVRRRSKMDERSLRLVSPMTLGLPVTRTEHDLALIKRMYSRFPTIFNSDISRMPWRLRIRRRFNMGLAAVSAKAQSATGKKDGFVPMFESKLFHTFDHRYASYIDPKEKPREIRDSDKECPYQYALPRLAYPAEDNDISLSDLRWSRKWLVCWRDVCRGTDDRTVIAAGLPAVATDFTIRVGILDETPQMVCCFLGMLNSFTFDYLCRTKINDTHLSDFVILQLPVIPRDSLRGGDLSFIVPRVVELTYTAWDMQPFARDLGYEAEPFRWDPERRALLRAELDAYYAYLYGLSKKELRYILDPKDVMGEDYPSETFRVLKEREIKEHGLDDKGMWRTQRLVLEAYDRFATDGTFDPARLEDPEYFPVVRAALAVSKSREQELERGLQELVGPAEQEARPVLFVEGASDAPILEAAWRALFPGEPMPFTILPAGGTDSMRSLAGKGGALKMALDKTILALADNDGAGRVLSDANDFKKLKAGGIWRQLENGIWWCLLAPSEELRRAMTRFQIPDTNWPCTVEQCFSAALRRQAAQEGAYAVSRKLFPDLLVGLKDERTDPLWELDEDDDAYWYVRAPQPHCKEPFAAWVGDPARLTRENFAGFEVVLSGLRHLLAQRPADKENSPQQRRTA